jgi:N6-L-threonylcarbamoyladenine synthase
MNKPKDTIILGIESSCDETAAAIIRNGQLLCNIIATQKIHTQYGGVVPELASRAHQQNIVVVVDQALKQAGVNKEDLSAIAFTRGPGLMGSLLVGISFSKAMALGLSIPLIEVNHMQAHILAHFIHDVENKNITVPAFPFLCLTVSGGHTQLVVVKNYFDMHVIGQTIDDAAGEAFDKAAKIIGLPYPGGPMIDKYAKEGNPHAFKFSKPRVPNLDFSFSGLKTAFMNFINNETAKNPHFINEHTSDICASIQHTIIDILLDKLKQASQQTNIKQIAIAGGVSANSGLRNALNIAANELRWKLFVPKFEYCTDNAAMIAITGYYKFLNNDFASQNASPLPRYSL